MAVETSPPPPDSITGFSSMLKSWTLSPVQGSAANGSASRPAFSSAVWKAVSAICSGARMAHQRQARNHCRMFGIGDLAAAQPRLLIELLHQSVAGVIVGDARSMA